MRSATVRFSAERMRMVMKMKTVTRGRVLFDHPAIVVKDIVITNIAPTRVYIVVDVIDAKPVVDPSFARGVRNLSAKTLVHNAGKHRIDFLPRVVVGEKVRVNDLLHGSLKPIEIKRSILELPQRGFAWFEVEIEYVTQTLKCCTERLMQRSFGVDAVNDINGSWIHRTLSSCLLSFDTNGSGWNPDDSTAFGDIGKYNRASANDRVGANVNTLNDGRTSADMCTRAYMYASAQNRSRRYMRMGLDDAIVIELGSCIDDAVFSNSTSGLDDCAGHNLYAGCKLGLARDDATGMNDRCEAVTAGAKQLIDPAPIAHGSNRANAIDQPDAMGIMLKHRFVVPNAGNSKQFAPRLAYIHKANHALSELKKRTKEHARMPARTDQNQR